jgi:hypothetical protein
MNMYERVEVQIHTFLTSALDGGKWSASHPSHFALRKKVPVPLDRRLSGPWSWSGCDGKEKNLCLCWELNPRDPAPSLITIFTELPVSIKRFYLPILCLQHQAAVHEKCPVSG